jgi:hypothetical protein
MSLLVKTKRQADFKDFKRFGAFKGLVEQKKNVLFNSSRVNWALYGTRFIRVLNWPTHAKKTQFTHALIK